MTWSIENSQNNESAKIRWETVPYFHGRVLDLGCGGYKTFPHWIGVDNGHHWGRAQADVMCEAEKLDLFANESCDTCFSSHLLEHIEYDKVPAAMNEWLRVLKVGGHLILYVPDEDEYPKCGTQYANKDHKFDVNYDKVIAAMEKVSCGWDLIDFQKRNQDDEYSLYFVFKKIAVKSFDYSFKLPKPQKTCAIIRYGAIGDNIQASSILPWLKEQGYHITFYVQSGNGHDVLKHDPHIDRFIVQGKDEVPPQFLDEFFTYTKPKYDKWINLCESVEGTLLAIPGRANYEWPNSLRAEIMDRNYLEFTHQLAEVPAPYRPKFYSTLEERAWASNKARSYGKRNILWSLSGSSGHKAWPHLDTIVAAIMLNYPDTHIVMVGDDFCKLLETGWEKERRVHCRSGEWTIRQSMAFAEQADLIIGTETGLLNAFGMADVPKIITLSHSSPEMLTKHWVNTIALQQPKGVGCPMSPCRMLHGANNRSPWDVCMKHEETGTAVCQNSITPDMMWGAVQNVFGQSQRAAA